MYRKLLDGPIWLQGLVAFGTLIGVTLLIIVGSIIVISGICERKVDFGPMQAKGERYEHRKGWTADYTRLTKVTKEAELTKYRDLFALDPSSFEPKAQYTKTGQGAYWGEGAAELTHDQVWRRVRNEPELYGGNLNFHLGTDVRQPPSDISSGLWIASCWPPADEMPGFQTLSWTYFVKDGKVVNSSESWMKY